MQLGMYASLIEPVSVLLDTLRCDFRLCSFSADESRISQGQMIDGKHETKKAGRRPEQCDNQYKLPSPISVNLSGEGNLVA